MLTNTETLCVKIYSNNQTGDYFVVGFGQFFGNDWIHVESDYLRVLNPFWKEYAQNEYVKMLARVPEHAQSMDKARSGAGRFGRVCIMETRLRQSTLRTSCIAWKNSRKSGVKLKIFRDPGFGDVSGEWRGFDVDVGGIFLGVPAHYFRISIDITVHRM